MKKKRDLSILQIELMKLPRHFIGYGDKILMLLEGRDATGNDGTFKRIVEHLSQRETRVVALARRNHGAIRRAADLARSTEIGRERRGL